MFPLVFGIFGFIPDDPAIFHAFNCNTLPHNLSRKKSHRRPRPWLSVLSVGIRVGRKAAPNQ
jgi:hypothetical protein